MNNSWQILTLKPVVNIKKELIIFNAKTLSYTQEFKSPDKNITFYLYGIGIVIFFNQRKLNNNPQGITFYPPQGRLFGINNKKIFPFNEGFFAVLEKSKIKNDLSFIRVNFSPLTDEKQNTIQMEMRQFVVIENPPFDDPGFLNIPLETELLRYGMPDHALFGDSSNIVQNYTTIKISFNKDEFTVQDT